MVSASLLRPEAPGESLLGPSGLPFTPSFPTPSLERLAGTGLSVLRSVTHCQTENRRFLLDKGEANRVSGWCL